MSSSPGPGRPQVDWSRISLGTKVAGIAAVVLLIATLFFPWAGVGPYSQSGTDYALGWIAVLAALAIIAVIAIELFAPQVTLPAAPSLIIIALGAIAIFCTGWHVLFVADEVSQVNDLAEAINDAGGGANVDAEAGRKWGVFVAFLAAVGATVGGYLKLNE
jgi:hypothetical protein